MGLLSKYQLLEMLRDGETKSYLAEEIATRRPVYVHKVFGELRPPNEPDLPSLVFDFLRNAPAEESQYFLDMGRDEFRVCIVTANEPQCLDLRIWLQSVAQPEVTPTEDYSPPPPPAELSASGPSESDLGGTQVFGRLGERPFRPPVAMPSEVPPPPAAPPQGSDEATGFTQAFFTVRQPASPAAPPKMVPDVPAAGAPPFESASTANFPLKPNRPPAAPVSGPQQKEPGEFTKLFYAKDVLAQGVGEPEIPAASAPPIEEAPSSDFPFPSSQPPAAPASGAEEPGSFTQMFFAKDMLAGGAGAPNPPAASAPPIEKAPSSDFPFPSSQPPAAPASGTDEPGSFTQMFFAKDMLEKAPAAPPPQVKEPPAPAVKPYAVPPQSPASQRPASPIADSSTEDTSPGEFTRMFSRDDPRLGGLAPSPSLQGFAGGEPAPAPPRDDREQGLRAGKPERQPARVTPVTPKPSEEGEITRFLSRSEKAGTPPEPVKPMAEPTPASKAPSPAAPSGRLSRPSPPEQNPEPPMAATVALPRSALGMPSAPSAPSGVTGTFERAFQDSRTTNQRPPSPVYESPSQPKVPPASSAQQNEPGEFTRMMQGYKPGQGGDPAPQFEAPKSSSPPAPPGLGSSKSAPGDFTMMMQGYKPGQGVEPTPQFGENKSPSPLSPSAAELNRNGPGEFTMIFRSDSAPKAPPPQLAPPPPVVAPPPSVPQSTGPGEYTRMFEISRKPAVAPMPGTTPPAGAAGGPPAAGAPSFAPPALPSAPPAPKSPFAPPPAPKPPQFQAPKAPPFPAPKPPAPPAAPVPAAPKMPSAELPAAAAPKKTPFLVLLIVLGCSLILAVALILFFALRH